MNALPGILTTKTICVKRVLSLNDLTICSENALHLDAPYLLIQGVPIRDYVNHIVFQTLLPTPSSTYYKTVNAQSNREDVTNLGTTEHFDSIDAMNIVSYVNYFMDDDGLRKESYVHLEATHTLNIQTPVYDISGNVDGYTNNIILKNTSGKSGTNVIPASNSVLKNYLYSLVNIAISATTGGFSQTSYSNNRTTHEFYVEDMGEYFTNTVITNKITTENVLKNDHTQPVLTMQSRSAINLDAPVILINGENLEELIKKLLDEDTGIIISTTRDHSATTTITFTFDLFESNLYNTQFTYDIRFDLILSVTDRATILVTVTFESGSFVFDPDITQSGIQKGNTYNFDNSTNQYGRPLVIRDDTSTDLYTQDVNGNVVVQNFSEYNILYATNVDLNISIPIPVYPKSVTANNVNHNDTNITMINSMRSFPPQEIIDKVTWTLDSNFTNTPNQYKEYNTTLSGSVDPLDDGNYKVFSSTTFRETTYLPYNALETPNVVNHHWQSAGRLINNEYIGFILPYSIVLNRYAVTSHTVNYTGTTPATATATAQEWYLEGSTYTSGSSVVSAVWDELDHQTNQINWGLGERRIYTIDPPLTFIYNMFRFRIISSQPGSPQSQVTLNFIEIFFSSSTTTNTTFLNTESKNYDMYATVTNKHTNSVVLQPLHSNLTIPL